jgi:Flp pilus assembly pilin Flp
VQTKGLGVRSKRKEVQNMLQAWVWLMSGLSSFVADGRETLRRRGEEGQATVEWMAIATLATVTLVGIFTLVKVFGGKVMDFISTQLGV